MKWGFVYPWKSHPVLIDPHPPPSLYGRLLFAPCYTPSHHHCYHPRVAPHSISTSIPVLSLPCYTSYPPSLSPSLLLSLFFVSLFSVARSVRHSRVSVAKKFTFAKKKSPRKIDANRLLAAWPLDRGCIGARGLAGVA